MGLYDRLLVTKSQRIQFKIGSLLSVLCGQITGSSPELGTFPIFILFRSLLSGLTNRDRQLKLGKLLFNPLLDDSKKVSTLGSTI